MAQKRFPKITFKNYNKNKKILFIISFFIFCIMLIYIFYLFIEFIFNLIIFKNLLIFNYFKNYPKIQIIIIIIMNIFFLKIYKINNCFTYILIQIFFIFFLYFFFYIIIYQSFNIFILYYTIHLNLFFFFIFITFKCIYFFKNKIINYNKTHLKLFIYFNLNYYKFLKKKIFFFRLNGIFDLIRLKQESYKEIIFFFNKIDEIYVLGIFDNDYIDLDKNEITYYEFIKNIKNIKNEKKIFIEKTKNKKQLIPIRTINKIKIHQLFSKYNKLNFFLINYIFILTIVINFFLKINFKKLINLI